MLAPISTGSSRAVGASVAEVSARRPGFSFRLSKPNAQKPRLVYPWFVNKSTRKRLLEEAHVVRQADQYWIDEMMAHAGEELR